MRPVYERWETERWNEAASYGVEMKMHFNMRVW